MAGEIYYIIKDVDGLFLATEDEMKLYVFEQDLYDNSEIMQVTLQPNMRYIPPKLESI